MHTDIILDIQDVSKVYTVRTPILRRKSFSALRHVGLSITRGVTLALIGESGCGKSTLARLIMKLESPTSGKILIKCKPTKQDITHIPSNVYCNRVQMIFQDPYSSLNPRKKIWEIITAPLAANSSYNKVALFSIAMKYSLMVGLGYDYLHSYPSALSGGQRQRVGIARALVLEPDLLILDEALQALDLSIQAQIINLLIDLQARLGLAYLFISHDMNMVACFADHVAVMHSGEIIEFGNVSDIFNRPSHQYTCQLVGKIWSDHGIHK